MFNQPAVTLDENLPNKMLYFDLIACIKTNLSELDQLVPLDILLFLFL